MREVVVVLPYVERKVLMQLRDDRAGVAFPGCWGFFGGSVDDGETPADTARREVREELTYTPAALQVLAVDRIPELGNLRSHAYACPLTVPVEQIVLGEGMDLGLFSREEIMGKRLYSRRLKGLFPVVGLPYILQTIETLLQSLTTGGVRHGPSL